MFSLIVLFEDNVLLPISKLLVNNMKIGDKFRFSGGVSGIKKELMNIDEDVLIYFDLVPDNKGTHDQLLRQIEYITLTLSHKVYIVPIICIEYIVTKFVAKYMREKRINGQLCDSLIIGNKDFNYDNLYSINKNKLNLEKRYKHLLSKFGNCFINVNRQIKNKHEDECLFYKRNCAECECKVNDCACDLDLLMLEKANLIYTMLPAFIRHSYDADIIEKYNLKINGESYINIMNNIRQFYICLCEQLNIDRNYKIRIIDLINKCVEVSKLH